MRLKKKSYRKYRTISNKRKTRKTRKTKKTKKTRKTRTRKTKTRKTRKTRTRRTRKTRKNKLIGGSGKVSGQETVHAYLERVGLKAWIPNFERHLPANCKSVALVRATTEEDLRKMGKAANIRLDDMKVREVLLALNQGGALATGSNPGLEAQVTALEAQVTALKAKAALRREEERDKRDKAKKAKMKEGAANIAVEQSVMEGLKDRRASPGFRAEAAASVMAEISGNIPRGKPLPPQPVGERASAVTARLELLPKLQPTSESVKAGIWDNIRIGKLRTPLRTPSPTPVYESFDEIRRRQEGVRREAQLRSGARDTSGSPSASSEGSALG